MLNLEITERGIEIHNEFGFVAEFAREDEAQQIVDIVNAASGLTPIEEYRRYFIFTYTLATNNDAGHAQIQFGNIKVVTARNFPAWSEVKAEIETELTAKYTLIPGSVVYSGHNEMTEQDFYQFNL